MKRKNIFILAGAGFLATFSLMVSNRAIEFRTLAEGEEEPEVVETTTEENTEEEQSFVSKIKGAWQSYLLPAILSINIGTIVSMITTVALSIKNRKTHKDSQEKIQSAVACVLELQKIVMDYTKSQIENSEKMQELNNKLIAAKELTDKQIELFGQEKACFDELYSSTIALISVISEIASSSSELVKSGVAEQIEQIKEQVANIK